jgi:hypothetical protein
MENNLPLIVNMFQYGGVHRACMFHPRVPFQRIDSQKKSIMQLTDVKLKNGGVE